MNPVERIQGIVDATAKTVQGGISFEDMGQIVRGAVETAEIVGPDLLGKEKRKLAELYCCKLIDRFFDRSSDKLDKWIEDLDLPGPEWLERAAWDPLLKRLAPQIVKPMLKAAVPNLLDLVIDATRGKVKVNK